jgi:hypothetical protein
MIESITAGRRIAETTKERVAIALERFNREAGPEILKELSRYVEGEKTGTFHLQIIVVNGEFCKVLFRPDWTLALDGESLG